jgi:tRNA dimethylallyltransferase
MQMNYTQGKKKVIAIVGPTAVGKTGIGVRLAKKFDGEIISADSRQVYRGLDLGTGKDLIEYDGVPHHLIDVVDPEEKMTLFDYLSLARRAIEDILSRGKLPIIVGGTGLYVQGIVEGFELVEVESSKVIKSKEFSSNTVINGHAELVSASHHGGILKQVQNDKHSREQLDAFTTKELNEILEKVDFEKYETIDHKNRHRLIRAIEMVQDGLVATKVKPDFEVLQIGIDLPRETIHSRIDRRVEERFQEGMLEEVEGLLKKGVSPEWLIGLGLEYREITNYLIGKQTENKKTKAVILNGPPAGGEESQKFVDGEILRFAQDDKNKTQDDNNNAGNEMCKEIDFAEMKQQLKYKIHAFARRQLTWFRRFPEINWLSNEKEIERFVKIFLEH